MNKALFQATTKFLPFVISVDKYCITLLTINRATKMYEITSRHILDSLCDK